METLYRLFGTDGLLYVGVSDKWSRRMDEHAGHQWWWSQVTRVDLEHYVNRAEVLAAERAAIKDERPRYNVTHNAGPVVADHRVLLRQCATCARMFPSRPRRGRPRMYCSSKCQRYWNDRLQARRARRRSTSQPGRTR